MVEEAEEAVAATWVVVEIMGTPYPYGMVIRLVIGDSLYLWNMIQIQICIKGIHGFKLISYASGMDQSEHHHRLAFAAADWCLRLHGWPIMPPLLGVYVFTDRPPRLPPTGVSACTAGLLCRRLLGVHVFTDRLAFAAADWCLRLHGWPIMPPLLGVYV
uniref:cysteine dioxygenase n=1 Tax=Oryza sativa subsp. japonica TaxID=39947 RepID=Q10MA8_ORYSJ|nr:hypothetical protein LOC_Os03g20150 [Oryza sativa Japonica Group]